MSNMGALILTFFLAAAAVMLLFVIAAGAPQAPYVDTAGNAPPAETNNTQEIIQETAAPVAGLATGVVLFLACLALFLAAFITWKATQGGGYSRGYFR